MWASTSWVLELKAYATTPNKLLDTIKITLFFKKMSKVFPSDSLVLINVIKWEMINKKWKLGMVVHTYNSSSQEAEAGGCYEFEANLSYVASGQSESYGVRSYLNKLKNKNRMIKMG